MQTLTMRLRQVAEMVSALLFAGTLDGCQPTRPAHQPGACASTGDCLQELGPGWYCDPGPPAFCRPNQRPTPVPAPVAVYGPPPGPPPAYGPPIVRPPGIDQPTPVYGPPIQRPPNVAPSPHRPRPGPASSLYGPPVADAYV